MAAFTSQSASAAQPGFITGLVQLLRSTWAYLRSRFELALIEGKEAGVTWLTALALVLGSLFIIVLGYFFLVFAIVFAIALAFDSDAAWIWVTLGAALVHFGGAVVLLLKVKSLLTKPVFQATLEEFKRDQEWLNATNEKLK